MTDEVNTFYGGMVAVLNCIKRKWHLHTEITNLLELMGKYIISRVKKRDCRTW